MRVGTRTELKRKWTPQAHRPKAPIRIGYEFTHLFVAIAPFTGKIFAMFLLAMFLPRLDQECFALFSKEFDQSLTQKTMLIADQATAHKAERRADTKIELQKLPPACPGLNPVERLFWSVCSKNYADKWFVKYLIPSNKQKMLLKKYYKPTSNKPIK